MPQPLTESAGGPDLCLVAALSHFLELKSELELLGFGRNTNLTMDQADAL
jgi:hypothetical protein